MIPRRRSSRPRRGLESTPAGRAKLLYQAGLALQRGGKFAEARASYKKTIELASDSNGPAGPGCSSSTPITSWSRPAPSPVRPRGEPGDLLLKKGFPAEVAALDAPRGSSIACVGKLKSRGEAHDLLERIVNSKALPETAKDLGQAVST